MVTGQKGKRIALQQRQRHVADRRDSYRRHIDRSCSCSLEARELGALLRPGPKKTEQLRPELNAIRVRFWASPLDALILLSFLRQLTQNDVGSLGLSDSVHFHSESQASCLLRCECD